MVPGSFWVLGTVILFLSRLTKLRAIEIAAIQTKSACADFFLVPSLRLGTKTGRLRLPLHEKIFLVSSFPASGWERKQGGSASHYMRKFSSFSSFPASGWERKQGGSASHYMRKFSSFSSFPASGWERRQGGSASHELRKLMDCNLSPRQPYDYQTSPAFRESELGFRGLHDAIPNSIAGSISESH
jgi:hypothetical protein